MRGELVSGYEFAALGLGDHGDGWLLLNKGQRAADAHPLVHAERVVGGTRAIGRSCGGESRGLLAVDVLVGSSGRRAGCAASGKTDFS